MSATHRRIVLASRPKGWVTPDNFRLEEVGELGRGVASGRIKFRESVAQGLESAPEAFIGMLQGKNFRKQLVKLV